MEDIYIDYDDYNKKYHCWFNFKLYINLWDELKLDDIYDQIKDDLDKEKQSKENLYSAMYLMDI